LDKAQYERLVAECAADPMLKLYVTVLGETGVRCESEALWLRWEDVDLENGFVEIVSGRGGHRTKAGRSRKVPMTPALRVALKNHLATFRFATYVGHPTPWVFHHERSRCHYTAGERITSMRRGLEAAAKRAEIPSEWVPHDLRHRRVTSWLAVGKNPVHVMQAVGHADLRTTMYYTHLVASHLKTLVDEDPAQNVPKILPKVG
jgi:integrase